MIGLCHINGLAGSDAIMAVLLFYNYLSKANRMLSDRQRTKGEARVRYNQIIYDEPERDNCIVIYLNTKTSGKNYLRVSQNQVVTTKTYSGKVHSLNFGKVDMYLCAACHAFTPHVNAWKN